MRIPIHHVELLNLQLYIRRCRYSQITFFICPYDVNMNLYIIMWNDYYHRIRHNRELLSVLRIIQDTVKCPLGQGEGKCLERANNKKEARTTNEAQKSCVYQQDEKVGQESQIRMEIEFDLMGPVTEYIPSSSHGLWILFRVIIA